MNEAKRSESAASDGWAMLYDSVNVLMATLGAHGEVCARDDRVTAVMDALHRIDASRPIESLTETQRDALRYRWLRARDLETIHGGGVFAGMTPRNVVLNGDDLDREIDAAMADEARFIADLFSPPNTSLTGGCAAPAETSDGKQ